MKNVVVHNNTLFLSLALIAQHDPETVALPVENAMEYARGEETWTRASEKTKTNKSYYSIQCQTEKKNNENKTNRRKIDEIKLGRARKTEKSTATKLHLVNAVGKILYLGNAVLRNRESEKKRFWFFISSKIQHSKAISSDARHNVCAYKIRCIVVKFAKSYMRSCERSDAVQNTRMD